MTAPRQGGTPPRSDRASDTRSAARPPAGGGKRHAPEGHAARLEALRLMHGVLLEHRMLAELTEDGHAAGLAPADRARALGLASAALKRLGQADKTLSRFVKLPPGGIAQLAMELAVVEAHALGVPVHAAVDGAVAAARAAGEEDGKLRLVNAVGRRAAGEQGRAVWDKINEDAARVNTPGWLWGRLSSSWGGAVARGICAAHLAEPPTDLTLHPRADAAALLADMQAEGLEAEALPGGGIRIARRPQISALPGFAEGAFWVQDMAAAAPARLLAPMAGERILDLCAAPGGKTMQLAAAGAAVTALDISDARLERLRENLSRTGLAAEVIAADAMEWEPDAPFDAILLDAPCSATGTVRRHPDLPHLKTALDLKGLTALQDALLDRAWGWLKPGGRLVFATCSLLPEEGEKRLAAFQERHADAALSPADAAALELEPEWVAEGALRLRPEFMLTKGGMDGFFAAMLRKSG